MPGGTSSPAHREAVGPVPSLYEIPPELLPVFEHLAGEKELLDGDLAWVSGWCWQESGHDPWALRYEPAFYRRYVEPLEESDTEEYSRSFSWGLFQVMGQVAREFGFRGLYLSELCDPWTNAEVAARVLGKWYRVTGSWRAALACYNGGPRENTTKPYRNARYVQEVWEKRELFLPGGPPGEKVCR